MTRVGRAVEKGETNGFMKVLVDAESRQILGAAILGTGGDEVIQWPWLPGCPDILFGLLGGYLLLKTPT